MPKEKIELNKEILEIIDKIYSDLNKIGEKLQDNRILKLQIALQNGSKFIWLGDKLLILHFGTPSMESESIKMEIRGCNHKWKLQYWITGHNRVYYWICIKCGKTKPYLEWQLKDEK